MESTRFAGYAALVAALLAAPIAARAQMRGEAQLFYDDGDTELNYIGLAGCEGGVANLRWWLNTNTFSPTGQYRFVVSDDPADADGFCPEEDEDTLNVEFLTIDALAGPQSNRDIQTADLPGALGFECTPGAPNRTITVCVEWWSGSQPLAAASGRITLELRPPPPPVNVRVRGSERALQVSWDKGQVGSGQVESWEYEAVATPRDGSGPPRSSRVRALGTRIERLENDKEYDVVVYAFSRGNNRSEPSETVIGKPIEIYDFWEHYQNLGGTDSGGCASGPAGLGAIVGLGLALALRRRHS